MSDSPAKRFVRELIANTASKAEARAKLKAQLDRCSVTQLIALKHSWQEWWARPEQIIPDGEWRSFGFLTGRGFGKTRAISEYVTREALSGRADRIALCAQNEDKTIEVMIEGESGLLNVAPPDSRPIFEAGIVKWPNGARAFPYTPHEPDNLHGPEHHLAWVSELRAWPKSTRDQAFQDLRRGLRLGYGKLVWDTTPRARNPLIRFLLDRAAAAPDVHRIVRGSMRDNVDNLTRAFVEEQEAEFGGTQQGREQIEGIFLDDVEGALFRQAWIDAARRAPLERYDLRVISVDPAISTRKGTDATGVIDLSLASDRQIYVLEDATTREKAERWGPDVLDRYGRTKANCVIVERNRGGDLVASVLRAQAQSRGWRVVVLDPKAKLLPHTPGVVYLKETHSTRSKETRAEPIAALYERGRVSHVIGANLTDLEDVLTTWDPSPTAASPDRLDALVHGVWELAGLAHSKPAATPEQATEGLRAAAKKLGQEQRAPLPLAQAIPQAGWGSRL